MLTLQNIFLLREWMPFSDKETAIFQYYFLDYLKENEAKLSKLECFNLACLANETQYQMRLLKSRIGGDSNVDENSNNNYIKSLMGFQGLVEFVKEKVISGYNETSEENKYRLSNEHYSYFTASETIKESIKQDFDLYFTIKYGS